MASKQQSRGARRGKLRRVAAHWAHAFTGKSDRGKAATLDKKTRDDFAKFGVKSSALPVVQDETEICLVPSGIWDSLTFFLSLQTQWRIGIGFGGVAYLGFDYAGVAALMKVTKMKGKAKLMRDIQIMEQAALPILNGVTPEADEHG